MSDCTLCFWAAPVSLLKPGVYVFMFYGETGGRGHGDAGTGGRGRGDGDRGTGTGGRGQTERLLIV